MRKIKIDIDKIDYERTANVLSYICYRFNRRNSPDVSPEQWQKIFGERTALYEKLFQQEEAILK